MSGNPSQTDPNAPSAGDTSTPRPTIARRSNRTGIYVAVAVVIIVILVVLVGAAAGWFTAKKSTAAAGSCPTAVTLDGNGANFILPLVTSWGASYQSSTSNLVSYDPAGAGAGITALTDKLVDFAATDEPLNTTQYNALPGTILTLPITGGALAVVLNIPGVTSHINLTGSIIAEIYLGQITTWNATPIQSINPGVSLPSSSIVPVVRSDAAGTTFVLTNFLSEDSSAWATGPGTGIQVSWPKVANELAVKGNSLLAKTVSTTANTIGYVDLTDTLNTVGLNYAKVENPAGTFVLPTVNDTASAIANASATIHFPAITSNWANVSLVNAPGAGSYPLATFSYFLVYKAVDIGYAPSQSKAQVIVQWLNWVVTTGQTFASGLNYVPVPSALLSLDKAALGNMTFDGSAIPSCTTG
jgi:phosphate transport system substrate-binding protein